MRKDETQERSADLCSIGFGPHLTLDLYGCDKRKLKDSKFIYDLLNMLPEFIGMNKISDPMVSFFSGNPVGNPHSFDKGGISAFVLLAESHISIHTFAAQSFASIDIFSCKDFDIARAEKHLIEQFGAKKAETNFLTRGKEFPKKVEMAVPIVSRERKDVSRKRR